MPAQLFNKYSCSSLMMALATTVLLSCGGGGSNSGSALPAGSQFDMTVPITFEDNAQRSELVIQLLGNDTDKPYGSLNGSGADGSALEPTYVLYRRNSPTQATLDGSFVVKAGKITLPGPIVIEFYDTLSVKMNITYNASTMYEDATGTCAGRLYFEGTAWAGNVGIGRPAAGTEGTVNYRVYRN